MTRRATLNISMPAELASYITKLVASGRYGTASEVVRAGLRLLQDKEGASPGPPPVEEDAKGRPDGH